MRAVWSFEDKLYQCLLSYFSTMEIHMVLTLRHIINGAIIVTFLLIVILFAAIQFPFQQHLLQKSIDRIEVLLQTLVERDTEQLANEIFDVRLIAIKIRIQQMRKVEGILGISVFNRQGKMLVSDGDAFLGLSISQEIIKRIRQDSQIQETKWQGGSALLYSKEIKFLGEELGFIQIHYSLANLEEDRRTSFLIDAGMLATILAVMLIVLNLILSKAILRPIRYLRDATQFIVRGNLENKINMSRKDELGSLAESFEIMRNAIKEQISDLERMTGILESTSDLVAIATPDVTVKYVNRAGREILGWGESGPLEDHPTQTLHPEWAFKKLINIAVPEAIENGTWTGESALIGAGGKEIPVSQVIISHRNTDGEVEFISTIMRDISEPKKTEDELRYLRNYLANIIDSMPSVLIGVDKDGLVTQWNAEAYRNTNIPPEKALGQPLLDVFPRLAPEKDRLYQAMQNSQMMFESKQSYQIEGENHYEDVTVYPLVSDGLEGAVIRIDDVTEKVRMEEMMIQSEKMLSVGGLAAGMAHEINNPLAGMMQAADVLKGRLMDENIKANREVAETQGISMQTIRKYTEARDIPRMLSRIRESGVRASEIIINMLNFARKSDEGFATHNLVHLLEKTAELAGSDYDLKKKFDFRQIEIAREYDTDLPDVPCEPGKIQQVLLNILRNGAEAMQEEGENSETTGSVTERKPRFIFRMVYEALSDMVRLEIEDNGPGMDEDTRKRIFEPFFTTKPPGNGTGLGLSVSYFIITENHSGTMNVESTPDQGAKFIIRLPAKR